MDFTSIIRPISFGKPPLSRDDVPTPKIIAAKNRRLAALREAGEILANLPGPGESLHAVMTGRYDLTDLLDVVFGKLGTVAHLRIATLSFNKHNVNLLQGWLQSGRVRKLTLLYSLFFREHSPEVVSALTDVIGDNRHAASRNHCKVVALEFSSGQKLSLEGSANLRTNSNQEQVCLVDGAELHDWHAEWIDAQVSKHAAG